MMKKMKRMLSLALVGVMLLALLTGCSMPKVVIGGTPKHVGTINGEKVATGEYLAYMYTTFMDVYLSNGLYQYAQYGLDAWSQELTYGTGDAAQKVTVAEYIHLATRDDMVTQAAMRQLMAKYNLNYDPKDLEELEKSFASHETGLALVLGITDHPTLFMYPGLHSCVFGTNFPHSFILIFLFMSFLFHPLLFLFLCLFSAFLDILCEENN